MDQNLGKSSEDYLEKSRKGGRNLSTEERIHLDLSDKIKGWGSDLDLAHRPGVPMDKAPLIGSETLYPEIESQPIFSKVHKSIEHAILPPVFGNVCPPRGLSGKIRDFAYGFSEGQLRHWILLMLADRVDVVEELIRDLRQFHIPNIPKEMGLSSQWKYNRKHFVKKSLGVISLTALGIFLLSKARKLD